MDESLKHKFSLSTTSRISTAINKYFTHWQRLRLNLAFFWYYYYYLINCESPNFGLRSAPGESVLQ